MTNLYAIRGWVEGDSQIVAGVRALVTPTPLAPHWHFSSPDVAHHGFAFFGAVVRTGECDAVKSQIKQIALEVVTDFSEIREYASGVFHIACLSDGETPRLWKFGGGIFIEEKLD